MSDKSSMDLTAISDSKNGSHVGEKRSHDNLGKFFFRQIVEVQSTSVWKVKNFTSILNLREINFGAFFQTKLSWNQDFHK